MGKNHSTNLLKENHKTSQGSALLIALMLMGILLMLSLGVSNLLIENLRDTRVLTEKTKAWYAAESGVERALLHISQNPPGSEEQTQKSLGNTGATYHYAIKAASEIFPVPEPYETSPLYEVLPLNESVTLPLFQGNNPDEEVTNFKVEYFLSPRIQEIRSIYVLENFDILRWKIFGIRKTPPDSGAMEVLNEFSPLQQGRNNSVTPSCVGTDNACWNAGKFYERRLGSDGKTEFHLRECNHPSKSCFLITDFLRDHTQNFLILTNMINPDMFAGSLTPEQKKSIANIHYRIQARERGKISLPTIKITSDGMIGTTKQSLDVNVKRETFLPVFNYALYRTAE